MKVIQLKPVSTRPLKQTVVEKLIRKYQRAGQHIRLQFIANNPAYLSGGMMA